MKKRFIFAVIAGSVIVLGLMALNNVSRSRYRSVYFSEVYATKPNGTSKILPGIKVKVAGYICPVREGEGFSYTSPEIRLGRWTYTVPVFRKEWVGEYHLYPRSPHPDDGPQFWSVKIRLKTKGPIRLPPKGAIVTVYGTMAGLDGEYTPIIKVDRIHIWTAKELSTISR